jgi:acetyl esterase/lipase
MYCKYLILTALCCLPLYPAATAEPPAAIVLWPAGAPGSESFRGVPEKIEDGKSNICSVHDPSITPYLPDPEKATGTAVLVAPGGGHRILCLGHEGFALGQWFADHGIAAFVLKYRLAREEGSTYTIEDHAMADTRRAIRLIRSRAAEWGIKPERIGVLGFSAGGELAAYASMKSDPGKADAADPIEKESSRPDFQGLIYPGKSGTFTVEAGMPPAFIAFGQKDRLDIARGMAEVYLKYQAAGVPAEMHIYSNAGHGFGYRPDAKGGAGDWPLRFREWLVDSKLLDEAKMEL